MFLLVVDLILDLIGRWLVHHFSASVTTPMAGNGDRRSVVFLYTSSMLICCWFVCMFVMWLSPRYIINTQSNLIIKNISGIHMYLVDRILSASLVLFILVYTTFNVRKIYTYSLAWNNNLSVSAVHSANTYNSYLQYSS